MCDLFAKRSIEMLQKNRKQFVVGYGTSIPSNIVNWDHQNHDHEEADTLLICIIREIIEKKQPKIKIVLPGNSDVIVLVIQLSAQPSNVDILFELLSSKSRRQIDINYLVNHLGQSKSLGLTCAYVYT